MSKHSDPFIKHADHEIEIQLVSIAHHYGKYHCVTCNKWIAWMKKDEVNQALKLGLVSNAY